MNFLKDLVLTIVGLIALNSMGYLAMETSMGYDIIVYGSIVVVELLVLNWFVKWIRPRAVTWDREFDDEYDCDDIYDDDEYDSDDCDDCVNDATEPDYNTIAKTYDEAYKHLVDSARNCDDIAKEVEIEAVESGNNTDKTTTASTEETVEEPTNAGEVVSNKAATLESLIDD